MIEKIEFFFANILAKCLGFSMSIKNDTISFTSKTKRGIKNLKLVLKKVFEK